MALEREMIYTFGFKLAELTQQNDSAGVGLLCLAIKDAGKVSHQMNYQDFKDVFQEHLPKRLEKVKVANSGQIVQALLDLLKKKQSLFTMTAH